MTEEREPAHLLGALFPPEQVRRSLVPVAQWRPYPQATDRPAWDGLPAPARERAVAVAETHLGMSWPELPATLFLEYHRSGNRQRYEQQRTARRRALLALVLGECVEGQGRFLDDIVNGIWATCEESFWGVPAHNYSVRPPFHGSHRGAHAVPLGLPDTAFPVIDLFAAETGAQLAWTRYLLGAQIGAALPVVVDRLEREINSRLLGPFRTIDSWRWLGKEHRANNWNPWIHSNILAMNLLLERDEAARAATVSQIIAGLDYFLATYHSDGGCDEGTSYWNRAGGSLFDCLDLLLRASDGRLDAFSLPLVQEIGRYIMRMHIGGPWYVNFADGAARLTPNGDLIYRYGARFGDPLLMQQGAYAAATALPAAQPETPAVRRALLTAELVERNDGASGRLLPALFDSQVSAVEPVAPLLRDTWLDGIQVLAARERAGSTDGLFLAAKGGNNAESHNHNDVGSFVLALDGQPVVLDIGVETYTRQTFSAQRYEIWTMRSSYHNLPLINGVEQGAGAQYAAREVACRTGADAAELTLDIAGAYPAEAQVAAWRRTFRLERGPAAHVTIEEVFRLVAPPQALALHLITQRPVDSNRPGILRCPTSGRPLLIKYDEQQFAVTSARLPIDDARLSAVWGADVYRVVLRARTPASEGRWIVRLEAGRQD